MAEAWAQAASGGAGGGLSGTFVSLVPFILIFVIFYFLLILPQQKKQKKLREMLAALKKGDRVVTSSGIWGTVTNLDKETDTVTLQIADNTKVRIQREHIAKLREEEGTGAK
jgi:preprotein translocase subunit YajC